MFHYIHAGAETENQSVRGILCFATCEYYNCLPNNAGLEKLTQDVFFLPVFPRHPPFNAYHALSKLTASFSLVLQHTHTHVYVCACICLQKYINKPAEPVSVVCV